MPSASAARRPALRRQHAGPRPAHWGGEIVAAVAESVTLTVLWRETVVPPSGLCFTT